MRTKFAVVSHVLPPLWSGQSVVLSRLLSDLDPSTYCLIGGGDTGMMGGSGEYLPKLRAPHYGLRPPVQIKRGVRFGIHLIRAFFNHALQILEVLPRAQRIAEVLRREHCQAVVSCTGDLINIPSAYVASRLVNIPFYAYVFDYYSHQMTMPAARWFAGVVEGKVLQDAAGVITPNESLKCALQNRYGIQPVVIHNPCDLEAYGDGPQLATTSASQEVRLVYTGAIYAAQLDAILNLIAALSLLQHLHVRLHLYTAIPVDTLAKMGVSGEAVVVHGHLPATEIAQIQRQADVLFLPLAFDSPYDPEIVRTSAPGKTGEYLASGKPILVHAPGDSFIARYFSQHECGLVVDRRDPHILALELGGLLADADRRRVMCENAWKRARCDFDVRVSREQFARLLDGHQRRSELGR